VESSGGLKNDMPRENYKAWQINLEDFFKLGTKKDRLSFLINFAVLAPSSHNSQPWCFFVRESTIDVFFEQKRRLVVGDEENRLSFQSIGCAITNLLVAADFFNFSYRINLFPDPLQSNLVASIFFDEIAENKKNDDSLVKAISSRSVNRGKYHDNPPLSFFDSVNKFVTPEIEIDFIDQSFHARDQIIELLILSSIRIMESNDFRAELSHFVKNNLTKSFVGMPASGMGIPTLLSFFASRVVRKLNMDKINKQKNLLILKRFTPIIGIISTKIDDQINQVKAGIFFQRVALVAESLGISISVWASPVINEGDATKLSSFLNKSVRPQLVFRAGIAYKKMPHSPRLLAPMVTKF